MIVVHRSCLCIVAALAWLGAAAASPVLAEPTAGTARFAAGGLRIDLDSTGQVRSIHDLGDQREYVAPGQPAPLLSRDLGNTVEAPVRMSVDASGRTLVLTYPGEGVSATVEVTVADTHIAFELKKLSGPAPEKVRWGPIPTTIGETIGETIGVVSNERFALGMQGLNIKTPAGARPSPFGSTLHAQTRDRTRPRTRSVGEIKDSSIPAMSGPDASLEGSRIALFGCPAKQALETIGRIELAEGLPHPMLDGVWAKISPEATRSYMIVPFDEKSLDDVLKVAKAAGLKYIYHGDPFKSWGHFEIAPGGFPDGLESLRRCVERAADAGVRVGVHTLSNFIHPHDPYVSPVPDPRLICAGSSELTSAVDTEAKTIAVVDARPFRERQSLSTVRIGRELIRYEAVSDQKPWTLLGCRRGSFGTTAAAHAAGAAVGKLWDHPYRVFFPNLELQDEIAGRLVDLFNRTGLRQISFDGLEGCQVTGEDEYAEARFVKHCFDGWRQEVISDSSQLKHFTWHIHTRMNWGEPWGKAMREGMPEYRFKNQDYFRRNLLPRMLGWFQIQSASAELEATSLDDVEWVLAKCAGFDAGCAWVTSTHALSRIGRTEEILKAIREWDRARHAGAFSDEQKARLRSTTDEFHLEPAGDARWRLTPVRFSPLCRPEAADSAGQSTVGGAWELGNPFGAQPLRFVLRVAPATGSTTAGTLARLTLTAGERKVALTVPVEAGQYLVCEADGEARVYDADWQPLSAVKLDAAAFTVPAGRSKIGLECESSAGVPPRVEIRFKTVGSPEPVG